MITLAKAQTYERFKGDIDGYSRSKGLGDTSGITDDDWMVIDQLCQSIFLIDSGKASKQFSDEVQQRLLTVTADEQTRMALRRLAIS